MYTQGYSRRASLALLLACVLMLSGCASSAPKQVAVAPTPVQDPDIRGIKWGFTPSEVADTEGKQPDDIDKNYILYDDTDIGGKDCALAFYFNEKMECYRVLFVLTENHASDNSYIESYRELKGKLVEKYGTPSEDKQTWKDDLFKADRDDYGLAIAAEHLVYTTRFLTDRTLIKMTMWGENYNILTTVEYLSRTVSAPSEKPDDSV